MKKRVDYIDIAKGIGIFLVVFGHTFYGKGIVNCIYSFHMPLFFFLSGIVFNEHKYNKAKDFFRDKTKTILLPYTVFFIVTYVFWLLVERKFRPEYNVSFEIPIIGFFYGTNYDKYLSPNVILWFLTCLFVTEVFLFYILRIFKTKISRLITFVAFGVAGYLLPLVGITPPPPLSAGVAFMAVLFAGTGFLLKDIFLVKMQNLNRIYALFGALILFSVVYFVSTKNGKISMAFMGYNNPILFLTTSFLGLFATLLLSYSINKNKIIQYFGVNTLILVGFSEPIKRILIAVYSMMLKLSTDITRNSIFHSLIIVVVCFVLFVPIIFIMNKHFYFLLGKKAKVLVEKDLIINKSND